MNIRSALIMLIITVLCSCREGGSITPVSELCVERLDLNQYPLDCCSLVRNAGGVTLRYRFQARDCLCLSNPVLICPEPDRWSVTVNGMPVSPVKNSDGTGRYLLAGVAREGENSIELQGRGSVVPVSLTGEFDVVQGGESGWILQSEKVLGLGPLPSQGLPFFTGEVSYSRQFEVPEKVGKRLFRLAGWKGGSCGLWINYEKVADIGTDPFEMNIGPYLQPGPNEVAVRLGAPASDGDFGLFEEFTIE